MNNYNIRYFYLSRKNVNDLSNQLYPLYLAKQGSQQFGHFTDKLYLLMEEWEKHNNLYTYNNLAQINKAFYQEYKERIFSDVVTTTDNKIKVYDSTGFLQNTLHYGVNPILRRDVNTTVVGKRLIPNSVSQINALRRHYDTSDETIQVFQHTSAENQVRGFSLYKDIING